MIKPWLVRPQRYLVGAVDFDGTNDYMLRGAGLTGAADGSQGTISFWFRLDGGDAATQYFLANAADKVFVRRTAGNLINIQAGPSTGGALLNISTVATYATSATWRHFLASWNLATAGARFIYVGDVADLTVTTFTNGTIDYTDTNWAIGATAAGASKLNGCLAELFFHTTYLDISVEANRRKFIDAALNPVNLGADGSTPLGAQPLVYQRVADGAAASTFASNLGSGGNFTITGALDVASTSPSD